MRISALGRTFMLGAAAFLLAGCDQVVDRINPPQLHVTDAYVRLSDAPMEKPSALYFTVNGGTEDTRLVAVVVPDVLRAEMHRAMRSDGMTAMEPVMAVEVPASGSTQFRPGGHHVMLWGVPQAVIDTGKLDATYRFTNGDNIVFAANFVGPDGEPVSASGPASGSVAHANENAAAE